MNRILSIFHKEIAGIHQAAILLGAFTLMSQILALVRDRMLARFFGADQALDLYYTAFRIPDLMYASIASLVSVSVLIPFLSHIIDSKKGEAKALLSSIFTVFVATMVLVSAGVFVAMPWIVKVFFSGLGDAAALSELTVLARILLLQPICLGISNLLGAVTQIGKRFFIYALSPIFYNLSIIFGLVALYPSFGIRGVMYGVVIGGLLHFLIQVPYIAKEGLLPGLTLAVDFKKVFEVIKVSIPRTIALSANMLELIAITAFASWLTVGSVSIFNLALNLQSVPFAIIGVSYALAAFPTLSACFARGEKEQFMTHIATAARHIIFWSIPITALFIVLRAQIVRTILGSGYFNWEDTRLTAACLALFVISLVAQGLELLFIRSYYAAGKTSKPLAINIISSALTILLPFLLLKAFAAFPEFRYFMESLFKVEGIAGSEVLMLPLGYTVGTLFNGLAFWIMFEKDFGKLPNLTKTLFSSLQAAVAGGFAAYIGLNIFDSFFDLNTLSGIFSQGFVSGIIGIAVAVGVFKLLGNREIEEVWAAMKQKVTRNKMIVSEPDKIEV
ncbi:MAG TPA: lipid II flippase MurJ [Candidatus Paceibacterota bacterium]